MIDCLILGDSIAVGVGQARPACVTVARVGISSSAYLRSLLPSAPTAAAVAVISLGVNDDPASHTLENLRELRARVRVQTAIWLLPGVKEAVRSAIQTVAAEHRDRLIDTRAETGTDHLHPTGAGYRRIASQTEPGTLPHAEPLPAAAARTNPHVLAVFHPFAPVNAPQWLPMAQFPTARPSLQQGSRFRMWIPASANTPVLR